MLTFCPSCSNTLTVSRGPGTAENPLGVNHLECRTCPYQFALEKRYFERTVMKRKEVEDVLGGEGSWANVDNIDAQCPKDGCDGDRAYFYMLQIRSADEPMTRFFKCMKCSEQWREN